MKYSENMNVTDSRAFSTFVAHDVSVTSTENKSRVFIWLMHRYDEQEENIEDQFKSMASTWHEETKDLSSLTQIFSHESYLSIIELGRPVVPLLFKELEKGSGYWVKALSAILHVDPVSEEEYGDLERITDVWLNWGRENGYID